ncbi:MAG: imidazole glycerol phosphate synthase subunit HisH [Candidatus Aramenus sulfurataquae]|jgi:glutamine amidotransferase|uniref:Imidazole glycerol phosphate synthase subunit HisH n=2 Tax=Candidatus Aramenus sulfurataquae TaxID=1326980 RepID=W7KKY1_9CREN|nr:MAG: imidazole glycerol phosphate synthase subunit HisH [Candidatus Aramenus sulfurataquae]MCL7343117.1 imidazole glycerol phosphate synthase subunit HisH [Candidatus Aramenus sulfurataquae]
MRAVVVNYGVGNLYSISSGLRRAGFEVKIGGLEETDLLVFPGVGSFYAVSKFIENNKEKIEDLRSKGVKFLGVCLGMQIMFEEGTEGGRNKGLGWFKGIVDRIQGGVKLPHIGWDKIHVTSPSEVVEGLDDKYAYFVHSYVAYTKEQRVVATSKYGVEFPAIVYSDFAIGTQFHPEKSSETGKAFFSNLMRWAKR